jgi:hypothetical protein
VSAAAVRALPALTAADEAGVLQKQPTTRLVRAMRIKAARTRQARSCLVCGNMTMADFIDVPCVVEGVSGRHSSETNSGRTRGSVQRDKEQH